MMNGQPLSALQLLFMVMLSVGLMNHVIIIPFMLEAAHRDAWIAALGALAGLLVWLPLLYFIAKQLNGKRLFDWLKSRFSSAAAYAVAGVSSAFLLLHSFVTLNDTVTFTTTSYLTATPRWALIWVIVADVIDVLNRYNEIRHTAWVYATDEPLSELFEATPLLNASSYYSLLSNPEEIFQQSSFIRPIRLSRLIVDMDEKADTARLPYLTLDRRHWIENKKPKPMLAVSGVCFVHHYSLQQCVRRSDLEGLRWLEHDIRRTPIYVKQKGKTVASLVVRDPKTKWSIKVKSGEPAFTVQVQAQGAIIERRKPLSRKQLTKLAEQTVKQEIRRLYELGKKQQIDILNLSEQLYRQRPDLWKKHQINGLIPLHNNTLFVNIELVISASGKEKLNYRAGD
ncbi:Ger(x)C family spore germination protein [Geobacillus stearothermophilus]|uniref:Ger(x)C family spore germination protein n=1 Tax=Geobacillus stearothermophilus TaxID=1422 RepID=UPI001EEDD7FB|nr:Ger(x)C family spore germination protein [Geobacillus stearothermophilus]MCK7606263.1 Ger(x)C family spore germination protein [Geobacillus stearothermophilus]